MNAVWLQTLTWYTIVLLPGKRNNDISLWNWDCEKYIKRNINLAWNKINPIYTARSGSYLDLQIEIYSEDMLRTKYII
jgi:hypothetical protein